MQSDGIEMVAEAVVVVAVGVEVTAGEQLGEKKILRGHSVEDGRLLEGSTRHAVRRI